MFERGRPVLSSLDINATVEFYESKLGFKASFVEENYAVLQRDKVILHFWLCHDKEIPALMSCYVDVLDIDVLYEEMKAAGVLHPKSVLSDTKWDMREFAILDGDGNLIRFGQEKK